MADTVQNPVVTPVGNSWIICRSKSHPNRMYYFNTFTGEAVWNLSAIEIEKAKNATKIIQKSGANMDECPEPKDPPQEIKKISTRFNKYLDNIPISGAPKICNNRTICDQPNQTHFAPLPLKNQYYNQINTISSIGSGYPMMSGLDTQVWNIPTQQIPNNIPSIMNMSIPNQYQMDLHRNIFCNNELTYVQSTCVPLNKRFETLKNLDHDNTHSFLGTKVNDRHILIENDKLHKNKPEDDIDLRDYISRKRQISTATDEPIQLFNKSRLTNDKSLAISISTDATAGYQRDVADDNPIKKDPDPDSISIKKNVILCLKNIAKRIHHKDLWHIVPDVDTILYHQGFLKFLVESDEECRLMVLETVMTDIRDRSRSDNIDAMNHARRAIYFISQSMRAGVATIAKDPAAVNNKSKSYILDCCLKLSKENYHIILLCNDKDLHNHEKAAHIPMYTVSEMKSLFGTDFKDEESPSRTNIFQRNPVEKTTVPNQDKGLYNIKQREFNSKLSDNEKINIVKRKISTVNTGTQTNDNPPSNKATADIGIQANLTKRLKSQTKSTQTVQSPLKTNLVEINPASSNLDNGGLMKRKEIKLVRSLSSQCAKKKDAGSNNFKWRRKRILFNVENDDMAKSLGKSATENQSEVLEKTNKPPNQSDSSVTHMQETSVSAQNNYVDNIGLDEASNSGAALNAQTNIRSEVVYNESVCNTPGNVNNEDDGNINCFMFEITSPAMEEYLKTRSDEWVSRFLQIMEEVLTQLVQKDNLTDSFSLPWSVHEATQCIKKKYFENKDIVDAADKLSKILYICSDTKGKIDINMSPDRFMKLFSYGVYLIDRLQAIFPNSDDLQTASESMAKLFNDIQNPNLDNGQNDSFGDIILDTVLDASSVASNTDIERHVAGSVHEGSPCSTRRYLRSVKSFQSSSKYNLRSQWKKTFQNNMEGSSFSLPDSFKINDQEVKFFTSLHLRKNDSNSENDKTDTPGNVSIFTSFPAKLNTADNETTNKEPPVDVSSNKEKPTETNGSKGPKIIRNFTLCANFEAKIKNKKSGQILGDIDEEKDNDEDVFVECRDRGNLDSDDVLPIEDTNKASPIKNDKLKYVISMLVREIRESFLVVYAFCEESQKRLKGPDATNDAKRILKTAEESQIIITQLFSSLNRIHNRDVTEMERLFEKFLDSEELKDLKLNENDFQEYRDLIGKCIDQASLLRDSVECIIRYVV